jgi:predicted transcriptional regulator
MDQTRTPPAQFRKVLRLFGLFGHPIRVVMFQRLARTPMSAGELARTLPISRTAVVQHLKLMEAAGLVDATSEVRRQVYRTKGKGLIPLENWIATHRASGKDVS